MDLEDLEHHDILDFPDIEGVQRLEGADGTFVLVRRKFIIGTLSVRDWVFQQISQSLQQSESVN